MSDIFLIFIPNPITCSPLLEKLKKTQHKTNTKKKKKTPINFAQTLQSLCFNILAMSTKFVFLGLK